MTFGSRLAAARRRANITQENFASALGVSRQAVSKWESDLTLPETEKLPRIAQLLQVSLDELMGVEQAHAASADPEPGKEQPPPAQERAPHSFNRLLYASFEYKSTRTVRGLPLVHVHFGLGKKAKGILAIGNNATGVLAVGFLARGVLSFGMLSLGCFSFGSLSLGLVALGAIALGAFAAGAIAVGLFALGALALGAYSIGALSVGLYGAMGDHAISPLGVAVGKSFTEGRYAWLSSGALAPSVWHVAAERVRATAPVWLRPLAALFSLFL